MKKVAIIGAGLSGLICAKNLKNFGYECDIFEKSRGPGGRTSTRRSGDYRYDHGAPAFSLQNGIVREIVSNPDVSPHVENWEDQYVFVPAMNSFAKALAALHNVHRQTRIVRIQENFLYDEDGQKYGPYDYIVFAIPAPQLIGIFPDMRGSLNHVSYAPCRTIMLTSDDAEITKIGDSPIIEKMIIQRSKPGRPSFNSYVFHTTVQWADQHIDLNNEDARRKLADELDLDEYTIDEIMVHGWRYANVTVPYGHDVLQISDRILACGDWCPTLNKGCGVERAIISGRQAAHKISELT